MMAQSPSQPATTTPEKEQLPSRQGGFVGDSCATSADCSLGMECRQLFGDRTGGYPSGICTSVCPKDTCFDSPDYPLSRCVVNPHESQPMCMIGCGDGGVCRRGWECNRLDRSDGLGIRYVCVPRPESARNALSVWRAERGEVPPPTAGPGARTASQTATGGSAAGTTTGGSATSGAATSSATTARAEANTAGGAGAASDTSAAGDAPDDAQALIEAVGVDGDGRAGDDSASTDGGFPWGTTIGIVVIVFAVLTLLRALLSGRAGGLLADLSTSAEDRMLTPLERLRRQREREREAAAAAAAPPTTITAATTAAPATTSAAHPAVAAADVVRPGTPRATRPLLRGPALTGPLPELPAPRTGDDPDDDGTGRPGGTRRARPQRSATATSSAPTRDRAVGDHGEGATPDRILTDRAPRRDSLSDDPSGDVRAAARGAEHDDPARDAVAGDDLIRDDRSGDPASRGRVTVPAPDDGGDAAGRPSQRGGRAQAPARPDDWAAPPNNDDPLMDVGRPLAARIWAGASPILPVAQSVAGRLAARVPLSGRAGGVTGDGAGADDEHDDLAPPLTLDVTFELLDELLRFGDQLRQRKGYDAVVFVERASRSTTFRRTADGQLRVQTPPDAFVKLVLAPDAIRRKGFAANTTARDAHLVSLVNLGRRLLGVHRGEQDFASVDELLRAAQRFSADERSLIETLSTPDLADELSRRTAAGRRNPQTGAPLRLDPLRVPAPEPGAALTGMYPTSQTTIEDVRCPGCASTIEPGDLACRHCGAPLHPRPFFCSSCGTRNVLFADGREQQCINLDCEAPIVDVQLGAEFEGRRLSVIFEMLSSFDEFRKLAGRLGEERYEATRDGERIVIWQLHPETASVLTEADRERFGLSARVCLPDRVHEQAGLRFATYVEPERQTPPLYALGAERLAEGLFGLLAELHAARLVVPALTIEDLYVNADAEIALRTGHRLRRLTDRTPPVTDERFAAPELAEPGRPTPRGDLYTAAAIWHVAMVGHAPDEALWARLDPAEAGIPEPVANLMRRCAEQRPERRPASAEEVITTIRGQRRLADLI